MELVCIKCPRGCLITIDGDSVKGNLCPKGKEYAIEEQISPMRTVTTLIKVNGKIVPVKTSKDIPKSMIDRVLKEAESVDVKDTKIGMIVKENILNLGVDLVVTGNPY